MQVIDNPHTRIANNQVRIVHCTCLLALIVIKIGRLGDENYRQLNESMMPNTLLSGSVTMRV